MLKKIAALSVLLWACVAAHANETIICLDEADEIQALSAENTALSEQISSLRALNRGEVISGHELHILLNIDYLTPLSTDVFAKRRQQWQTLANENREYPQPLCEQHAKELTHQQQSNQRIRTEFIKLLEQLLSLSDKNLLNMVTLLRTKTELQQAHSNFLETLSNDASTKALCQQATRATTGLMPYLDALFVAFLYLEPPSIERLLPHKEVMSVDLILPPAPEAYQDLTANFQTLLYRTRIELTHIRVAFHHLIWSNLSIFTLLAPSTLSSLPELFVREISLFTWHLEQTLLELHLDIQESDWFITDSLPLLLISSLISGILLIALALYAVKLTEKSIYWLHDRATKTFNNQRWIMRSAQLMHSIAPILPWLLLLISLHRLDSLFTEQKWYPLLWIVPLLQLCILFALVKLVLRMLMFRIANQPGVTLTNDQLTDLHNAVLRACLIVVIPWAVVFAIDEILGASLLLQLSETIAFVITYVQLGRLLQKRRDDYIANTERALASQLPSWMKQHLTGSSFVLAAPLLLPVQLVYFFVLSFGNVFQDFDWYRRLSARWFWLRARYQNEKFIEEERHVSDDYRRWFYGSSLDGQDLPVIDTGLTAAIEKNVDRWMEDHVNENTLLVVGEKGIGKSLALKKLHANLKEKYDDIHVLTLKIEHKITQSEELKTVLSALLGTSITTNTDALCAADKTMQPTIVILDECQNLFLTQFGGLEAWKTLLDLTSTQLGNIFWLLSINNQSWAYLDNVFGRQYQMRNIIYVKSLSQSDIRSLILSRTHLSGYKPIYDDQLLNYHSAQQHSLGRDTEQRFFSLLWDSCRGTPMIALEMWLTAVSTRGNEVVASLPQRPSSSELNSINNELLFVYRAIVTHENLTLEQMKAVTQQSEHTVRYAIKTGLDMGFLCRDAMQRYRIAPIWYHSLVHFLSWKNMIHE